MSYDDVKYTASSNVLASVRHLLCSCHIGCHISSSFSRVVYHLLKRKHMSHLCLNQNPDDAPLTTQIRGSGNSCLLPLVSIFRELDVATQRSIARDIVERSRRLPSQLPAPHTPTNLVTLGLALSIAFSLHAGSYSDE
jgi:hypothetical protein